MSKARERALNNLGWLFTDIVLILYLIPLAPLMFYRLMQRILGRS